MHATSLQLRSNYLLQFNKEGLALSPEWHSFDIIWQGVTPGLWKQTAACLAPSHSNTQESKIQPVMSSKLREGGESSWKSESRKAVEGGWRMLIKLCWDQLQKQKQSGVPAEDKTKIFLLWEQILSTYNLNSLCPKSTWALLATSTSGSPSEGQSNFYLKYFLNASSCPQPLSQPCYHY